MVRHKVLSLAYTIICHIQAQNNETVHNINQIMLERNISAPVISVRDKNDQFLPNIINVVCDGNVNFSDVLGHALATRCNSTVYHVTEKSNTILQQNNSQTSGTLLSFLQYCNFHHISGFIVDFKHFDHLKFHFLSR